MLPCLTRGLPGGRVAVDKGARGTFIDEVPEMRIEGGLVHIVSEGGHYYMRPSLVRRYVDRAEALLEQWDAQPSNAVPLKGKSE